MHSIERLFKFPVALALIGACLLSGQSARANVYATNIKLNNSLANVSTSQGSPVTISYILNEPATSGVTINILSGATVVRTISIAGGNPGTSRGTNSVTWDGTDNSHVNVPPGSYSVGITAAATGYADWTQITKDTDPAMAAYYPWGIDVDKNTNSPYYGRVVMSCASGSGAPPARTGLYKMNADGSAADEGWYGYANYSTNDYGTVAAGQMPPGAHCPEIIRIGEDDRIYFCDNSSVGAVIACDILATTNQIVIDEGTYTDPYGDTSFFGGPANYAQCPDVTDLSVGGWGIRQFDVSAIGTSNAAIYLVDTGDFPSWGVWEWHLTNGTADTNDNIGSHCVVTHDSTNFAVAGSGIMVDYSLDIFVSQNRSGNSDPLYRTFCYTNWNGGVLPPNASGDTYPVGWDPTLIPSAQVQTWEVGTADPYMTAIWDTVINSRSNPTLVAVAMAQGSTNVSYGYNHQNGGIRILSSVDGSVVKTNLDLANWYNSCAFDAVGNIYGCSRSTNVWRAWSPPGANQATTKAVFNIQITQGLKITSASIANGVVTVNFTGPGSDPTAFKLVGSSTVHGTYSLVIGSIITGSGGSFTATAPAVGTTQFYQIQM